MNFENLQTDLISHPITGYLHTGERLYVDLISHIQDNLYVGGCINGIELGDFFGHIFSMYAWERYSFSDDTKFHEVVMYDNGVVDVEAVNKYSKLIVDALDTGENVLVHCQAGINRSNLLSGAALVRMGHTPEDAIALLRNGRSNLVLANGVFEEFLLNYNPED